MIKTKLAHLLAILSSLFLSSCLPLLAYLGPIVETEDIGGPANLILIPCLNLIAGLAICLVLFFVFRRFRDEKSVRFGWAFLLFMLTFVGVIILNRTAFAPGLINDQLFRFIALGGSGLLIAGPTYWFVYELAVSIYIENKLCS